MGNFTESETEDILGGTPQFMRLSTGTLAQLYAVRGAFVMQWKWMAGLTTYLGFVWTLPYVVAMGWIARKSEDPGIIVYIAVGAFMMVAWNACVFRMGLSLRDEAIQRTLDFNLISRTPLLLILLGKILAIAVPILGFTGTVVVMLFSSQVAVIALSPSSLISVLATVLAVVAVGFIFAPLSLLVGGESGYYYFDVLLPLIPIFSGFFYPVALMAPELQVLGQALPTYWAMDALLISVGIEGMAQSMLHAWILTLAESALYVGITAFLFVRVEARMRNSGSLGVH